MIICLKAVLSPQDVADAIARLDDVRFADGRATAGWHARLAKRNEQADGADSRVQEVVAMIERRLLDHEVFAIAARPKRISGLLVSRYGVGMEYASHVDDALMRGVRSDLSFTVFLRDSQSYDGGDLVLERSDGEQSFKLDAGDVILYSSTTLHRVDPVTRGERLVVVGWMQSLVRRDDQRELLFDLETARRAWFAREGKSAEFDLLSKCVSNLLRQWAEP